MRARTTLAVLASTTAFAAASVQDGSRLPADTLPAELPGEIPLGLPPELAAAAPPAAEVALGRRLFFDPILSLDRSIACATCHDPGHGFSDPRPRSLGVLGRETERHAPTLLNRALGTAFMWDGSAATLEEQVLLPIENELEMSLPLEDALTRLAGEYGTEFEELTGGPPTRAGLASVLAAFVRSLLRGGAPIDHFRAGEIAAMSSDERGGMWLFESRGGCWRCHVGSNFTDEGFHSTGIGVVDGMPADGRFAFTGDPADRGRFKTPTLRGLRDTAPYMHDGSLATLEEVVEFYRRGANPHEGLDEDISPVEMTDEDASKLVAFLKSL